MAIASGTQGTCSWNIDDNGKLIIKPTSGSSGDLQFKPIYADWSGAWADDSKYYWPWYAYRTNITSVVLSGSITNTYTSWDTPYSGEFTAMFFGCNKLASVSGLSSIKEAIKLRNMFAYCSSLHTIDVSSLDVTNVTDMNFMFMYAGLTSITGIKSTNKLKTANSMFAYCQSLSSLDLTNFNTTGCSFDFDNEQSDYNGLRDIFAGTTLLTTIKLGNNFYIKPYSQYAVDANETRSRTQIRKAKNITNGIIISSLPDSDAYFSELTNAQRAGTWQRNVSFTYDVSAYRSTSGTADEDGENATFDIRWATDATTTDRIFRIYQKEAGAVSYPTSPVLTQNVTGNSGNTTLTINNIGDNAYDFKVEFYDGTDTYLAFPSIQTNIRLITIDQTGNVCLYLDTSASSGTTDAKLYEAIVALGWQGDVLV